MNGLSELNWTEEQMKMAHAEVMTRFARNSVAKQFIPDVSVDATDTTTKSLRFNYSRGVVEDRDTYDLSEPYAFVRLTRSQGDEANMRRAMTTLNRAASALARAHDTLIFSSERALPPGVQMPEVSLRAPTLREAALRAERDPELREMEGAPADSDAENPIPVRAPQINESLVAAAYAGVLRLEGRGYYCDYHVALGERLWEALHTPTTGSLVLPRDRIEPTLCGGGFHRSTTLREDEALMISLDGPTVDFVWAGDAEQQPMFEWLRAESDSGSAEELYVYRARWRGALRVREERAVVRLRVDSAERARRAPRAERS